MKNNMDKLLTPQQELFLVEYTNPKSENFSNAYRSALKAGYSDEYAQTITSKDLDWLSENVGDMKMLEKAEKVLDKTLTMNTEIGDSGYHSDKLLRIQQDTAKFIASTVGKGRYSTRTELTGKGGGAIEVAQITGMRIIKDGDTIQE